MTRKSEPDQPGKDSGASRPNPVDERARRRAATLRENLRRRKQQQRLRRDGGVHNPGGSAS